MFEERFPGRSYGGAIRPIPMLGTYGFGLPRGGDDPSGRHVASVDRPLLRLRPERITVFWTILVIVVVVLIVMALLGRGRFSR